MISIKEIKNQLKVNNWETKKAVIDSNVNRIIELNSARLILLELLVKQLDNKLNMKQLVSKVS